MKLLKFPQSWHDLNTTVDARTVERTSVIITRLEYVLLYFSLAVVLYLYGNPVSKVPTNICGLELGLKTYKLLSRYEIFVGDLMCHPPESCVNCTACPTSKISQVLCKGRSGALPKLDMLRELSHLFLACSPEKCVSCVNGLIRDTILSLALADNHTCISTAEQKLAEILLQLKLNTLSYNKIYFLHFSKAGGTTACKMFKNSGFKVPNGTNCFLKRGKNDVTDGSMWGRERLNNILIICIDITGSNNC